MTKTIDRPVADGAEGHATDVAVERRRSTRHKLVIEVSADLHRRILKICATRGLPVNEAVRAVLDRSFPG